MVSGIDTLSSNACIFQALFTLACRVPILGICTHLIGVEWHCPRLLIRRLAAVMCSMQG